MSGKWEQIRNPLKDRREYCGSVQLHCSFSLVFKWLMILRSLPSLTNERLPAELILLYPQPSKKDTIKKAPPINQRSFQLFETTSVVTYELMHLTYLSCCH